MGVIFISYRRADVPGEATHLYENLAEHFPGREVFQDIGGIDGSTKFRQVIRDKIDASDVVLVLIGQRWATLTDEHGRRKLDDPGDLVRRDEVVRALNRGVGVLPVLVDGAPMPAAADLPADMQPLLERHARPLRNGDWSTDLARIVNDIRKLAPVPAPRPAPPRPPLPPRMPIVAILVAVAVIAVAVAAGRAGFDRVFAEVPVPRVAGQEADVARDTLQRAGFRVGVVLVTERANARGQPFNHVIATVPAGGAKARRHLTTVTMYLSAVLSLGPTRTGQGEPIGTPTTVSSVRYSTTAVRSPVRS